MCNFLKNLFKKPQSYVIAPVVMGSDEVYLPSISNASADWSAYLTQPFESQWAGTFDEDNCVTQSGIHCIEAILNYYFLNKLFPQQLQDFFNNPQAGWLNEKGFINISERFTATMAGTTHQGLGMDKFWQSVNRDGIVPQKVYDDPKGSFTWLDYYAPVPQKVKDAGILAAKLFQFNWQVIINNNWTAPDLFKLQQALKESPLHFAGPLCGKGFDGIERTCPAKVYQHARVLYKIDKTMQVLDQYEPFQHQLELIYPMPCVIKASLKIC